MTFTQKNAILFSIKISEVGYMKKIISVLLSVIILLGLCSCDGKNKENGPSIVVSVSSAYDWVMNILGDEKDNFEVTLLANGDIHSYQPSSKDFAKISECDLFIYLGTGTDSWAETAIKTAKNKNIKALSLSKEIESRLLHVTHEHDDHSHMTVDEHLWLSLKNAEILCNSIAKEIISLDSSKKAVIQSNLETYTKKLLELDKKYSDMVASAKRKTVIFGDKYPFSYLFNDYGIGVVSPYLGCSADSEVSFETVTRIANALKSTGIKRVLVAEDSDTKLARTIIENAKVTDCYVNPLYSITTNEISYIEAFERNLETLKTALN